MRRWRKDHDDASPGTQRISDATRARIQAQRDLADARRQLEATRRQTPRHKALGDQLRRLREENHFAAAFQHSIQGDRS